MEKKDVNMLGLKKGDYEKVRPNQRRGNLSCSSAISFILTAFLKLQYPMRLDVVFPQNVAP